MSDEDGLVPADVSADVPADIPADVARLVRDCIDRLETLHVLLLLHATESRTWTIRDVSLERRSSLYGTEMSLGVLVEHGLVAREDDVYWFSARTPELASRTAALADCYRTHPTAVIALIFSGGAKP